MTKHVPQENQISLLAPVRIYTAKELAAMPLSVMNACIEAQEKFAMLEQTTQMGGSNNHTPFNGRRISIDSGYRKITHTLQDCWRILSTPDYSAVEKRGLIKLGG